MPEPVDQAQSPSPGPASGREGLSWLELLILAAFLAGGFVFLRDPAYWGRAAYVGSAQFGDAEFWWNGALHFSQGIVAENPNLTFRMGYATFGGLVAAVCGPDYRVFHQILLAIFLVTAGAMYLSLRGAIGRIAAALAVVLFVFNPFTAEWLAISTSDALGLVLNLVAVMALAAGVRDGLHLRWIAVFGIFLACASLTRPLMTPFIVPTALAVVVTGWRAWRRTALALGVLGGAFILPTLAWMGFMGATTGNFALTGASQDSSAFYAASDPQIQVWRPDMYAAVRESAEKRYQVPRPTPKQLNAEFWAMTRANYAKHWRFHVERVWLNLKELARFTPARATLNSPQGEQWRLRLKWILALGLAVSAFRRQRQWTAILLVALGALWVFQPASGPWLVLAGGVAGLVALLFRRTGPFVWAAYWWVGIAALYLTGGTWGPPIGPTQDLNALGYRLGFQFFFANDLLVAGLLGHISLGFAPARTADEIHPLLRPSPAAGRLLRIGTVSFLVLLAGLLGSGGAIVGYRLVTRGHTAPVPYPDLAPVQKLAVAKGATVHTAISPLRTALGAHAGEPILTPAMSSGFIWNMPGQERSMLLLYQQDNIRPVALSPRQIYAEVSRHLPEREWMNRQGAWVLRSFPNTAQVSNHPYYFEMPAVQAFVPLTADGRAYDTDHAVIFPLAKTATQLVGGGALNFTGAAPEWSMNSGPMKFPRRFALRADPAGAPVGWDLDLTRARGTRAFSFSVQREADAANPAAHLRLATNTGEVLWEGDVSAGAMPTLVQPVLPADATSLRLTSEGLKAGDILWFYELVLRADDFTQ
jgi:hypothetical protein